MTDSTLLSDQEARFLALVRFQFALVHKMHRDEAWHKGSNVHHFVCLEDPEVIDKVCDIILGQGDDMLDYALRVLGLAFRAA